MRTCVNDVKDWRTLNEELEKLKRFSFLDEHQNEIRKLLRHRGCWRMKECALAGVREMREPGEELIQDVCSIMCDEQAPPTLRMAAVFIIRDFVLAQRKKGEPLLRYGGVTVVNRLRRLVGVPMHPILQMRIVSALEEIDKAEMGEASREHQK